ncbi:MAG: hypothetical protein LBE67_04010 [Kocuria palustris]|nr:hypothetical protein [Kocuria palustris]
MSSHHVAESARRADPVCMTPAAAWPPSSASPRSGGRGALQRKDHHVD